METKKISKLIIELQGAELKILEEALFKILAVENAPTPHVLKSLNNDEVKLLEEIYNTLKSEK